MNFTPVQLDALIREALAHAAAPPGSARYVGTPDVIKRLIEGGDSADGWVFVCGMIHVVIEGMGLDRFKCSCGDPEHRVKIEFGLAPLGADGAPDYSAALRGDDLSPELHEAHPETGVFADMVAAEIADDDLGSQTAFERALDGGYAAAVVGLATEQAGHVRRSALGIQGAN